MNGHEETTMTPQHTFGGRFFDRYVYEFEVPEPTGLEGSEVAPAAPAPVEPAAVVPPVEPEAVVPAPLGREDLIAAAREAAMEGSGEAFRAMMAEAEAAEAARRAAVPTELPEWDPYDPNTVLAHMTRAFTPLFRQLEAAIAPALAVTGDYTKQEGERQATAILDGLKTGDNAIGEFDNARAIDRARVLALQGVDPEEALKRAATEEVAYLAQHEADLMKKWGIVAEAHRTVVPEPGSGGAAAGEVSTLPRGSKGYEEQLRRSLAARGQRPGVAIPTG